MKNTVQELLEGFTNPFAAFSKPTPELQPMPPPSEEDMSNAIEGDVNSSDNSIVQAFQESDSSDRLNFMHKLVKDESSRMNLLHLMLDDDETCKHVLQTILLNKKANQWIKNHVNTSVNQPSRPY